MKQLGKNHLALFLALPLLTVLTLHAYIGSYIRPIADDYCSLAEAQSRGIWNAVFHKYLTWSGRYAAHLLDFSIATLNPHIKSLQTGLVLLIWMIILYWTLKELGLLIDRKLRNRITILWASLILFTILNNSPAIVQSLYWGQGMHSVIPPLILFTLMIAIVGYRLNNSNGSRKEYLWFGFILLIAFLSGGFSETYAVLQVAFFVSVLLIAFMCHQSPLSHRLLRFCAAGFIGSLIALLFILLSPGNEIRQSYFPPTPGIVEIFLISIWQVAIFARNLMAVGKISALIGVFAVAVIIGSSDESQNDLRLHRRFVRLIFLIPILTFGMLFVSFVPAAYGMSSGAPARTQIIMQYTVVVGVTAFGVLIGRSGFITKLFFVRRRQDAWRSIVGIALVLLLAPGIVSNGIEIIRQKERFAAYAAAWDDMNKLVTEARDLGEDRVSVELPSNPAALDEISSDSSYWVNECVDRYYGLTLLNDRQPP